MSQLAMHHGLQISPAIPLFSEEASSGEGCLGWGPIYCILGSAPPSFSSFLFVTPLGSLPLAAVPGGPYHYL